MTYLGHRSLIVWQRSIELAVETYGIARQLPDFERYGLAAQMRRAAVSIPSNIAEGSGRRHRPDYSRLLGISRGSARELDTHFELAVRCDLVSEQALKPADQLLGEVSRMLSTMIRQLQSG